MPDLVSFYMDNIPQRAVAAQRGVFDHFGLQLRQIKTPYSHGESMTRYMNEIGKDVIFFDIDAIPLSERLVPLYLEHMAAGTLIGVAQSANGYFDPNDRDHIYAAPSCLGVTQEVFTKLGRISFTETHRSDVAEELTRVAEQTKAVPIKLLMPSESEDQEWALGVHGRYGHGTTYEGLVYHAFQARMGMGRFIRKCQSILRPVPVAEQAQDIQAAAWLPGVWSAEVDNYRGVWTFINGGIARRPDDGGGRFEVIAGQVIVLWNNGHEESFEAPRSATTDVLVGENTRGLKLTLRRVG